MLPKQLLILIFLFCASSAIAQVQDSTAIQYDTVFLQKDFIITIADSSLYVKKDTTVVIPDSLEYIINTTPDEKTIKFYKTLKDKFYQTRVTRELYDLLFTDPPKEPSQSKKEDTKKSSNIYIPYKGKIIGNITIKKLNVFGTSIEDTTRQVDSKIVNTGNNLHINTHSRVLRNNLLIEKGDLVDPLDLSDNERVIRELPYIQDARILISPRDNDSDTVDIILVTKDVWSISVNFSPNGFTGGRLQIDDKNILGFGHELDNYIYLRPEKSQSWGYEGVYRIPNLYGTFVTSEIRYANTYFNNIYGFRLYRNFITPETKYAGGLEISSQAIREDIFQEDSTLLQVPHKFNLKDIWLGRAFSLRNKKDQRPQIIIAGRYVSKNYTNRPLVEADSNREYHSNSAILGSIGYSRREYYKGHYIYGFGRTEDIPQGSMAELTGGVELGEFYNRYYTGVRLVKGNIIPGKGFLFGELNLGGYLRKGIYEQGILKLSTNGFTDLFHIKRYSLRQFLKIEYTRGLRRFNDEFITINDSRGIRGLNSIFLRGTNKLALNIETLVFTPLRPVGFQFAFFGFADFAVISSEKTVLKGDYYSGFGLGLRVRNDNLTFNTFQIRLGYYPKVPINTSSFDLDISGTSTNRQDNFQMEAPAAILFE